MAVARAKDGTTLHVRSGPCAIGDRPGWFLEIQAPAIGASVRAEWSGEADFSAEQGAEISLLVSGVAAKALLKGTELTLERSDDMVVNDELGRLGHQFLRFDPEGWPYRPEPESFSSAEFTFSQFLDCVSTVTTVAGGIGAAAGGIATLPTGGEGAGPGGAVGLGLGAVGGSLGCGIGWAVNG